MHTVSKRCHYWCTCSLLPKHCHSCSARLVGTMQNLWNPTPGFTTLCPWISHQLHLLSLASENYAKYLGSPLLDSPPHAPGSPVNCSC
eukprot:372692-Pelagomonas_calceolata.AAC.11